MKDLENATAARITALREKKKITQEELAEMLGLSVEAVASYESGRRLPRGQTIDKMIEVFGISPSYFLGPLDVIDEMDIKRKEKFRDIFLQLVFMEDEELDKVLQHLLIETDNKTPNRTSANEE